MTQRMPVLFVGHGDPMIALRQDAITEQLQEIGRTLRQPGVMPKAILAISAHWFTRGTFVQKTNQPRHINDMYGFPPELYQVEYPVRGSADLSDRVLELLGDRVQINNEWGIDHGSWTMLVHLFPNAEIPVVQLSINAEAGPDEAYAIGQALAPLRDEGYLILGSGNVVHNLREVRWNQPGGSIATEAFNQAIIDAVESGSADSVLHFDRLPYADYAVPTPEHFLPLIYCLGAAGSDHGEVFNNRSMMGSLAMTGFLFGEGSTVRRMA